MPTTTYRISFSPSAGSYGTLVEYREGTGAWVTPSAPANPTTLSYYDLALEKGSTYTVRLSSVANRCTPKYKYISITVPLSGTCCPSGYTLSPEEDYCYKVEEVPATPPISSENAVAKQFPAYSACGSYIYEPGYNLDGTGTSLQITTANSFWTNGTNCATTGATYTDGPLNRCGIWGTTTADNQEIGFSICLDILTTKTYYIGIAADNLGIIKLDNTVIVEQDPATLSTQYGISNNEAPFRVWHIYPVEISSGEHILELIGKNGVIEGESNPAAIGAEVYDNTPAEIIAATSYDDLNLVFSTKDYVGQPIQFGTDGIGYTCPDGYALTCGEPFSCKRILTTSTYSC
jgi:hypothetical protein